MFTSKWSFVAKNRDQIQCSVFVRRILFHMRTWVRSHYILQDLSCQHPACSLCVVPCVLCLAGQKTIFPKSILSSLIFASVCHCLSSCPSCFFLYALSHLLKASPSRLASSDVYHAPSMSVSVQNMGLCTLKKPGPWCWIPYSLTRSHTTKPQELPQCLVVPVGCSSWVSQWTKSTQKTQWRWWSQWQLVYKSICFLSVAFDINGLITSQSYRSLT